MNTYVRGLPLMSQIVIIENNETLRSLIEMIMMKCLGLNVVSQNNADEAMAFLETDFNNELIICRDNIGGEKSTLLIIEFLKNNKLNVPLIVLGEVVSDYPNLFCLNLFDDSSWKEIVYKAGAILNIEINLKQNLQTQSFTPVGINYFLNIGDSCIHSDIYIRVKKGDEYHFIKRFHAGEQLIQKDIEKYKSSGLKFFYISKDQFKDFVDQSTIDLALKLGDKKKSGKDRNKLNSDSYNLTAERIQCLGIDEISVQLVEASVLSMKESLGEKNALNAFLESLQSNKNSYGFAHSYLSCLILHQIAHNFYWFTFRVKEKITLITYFHDISLPEELVGYNSADEVMSSQLVQSDRDLINNHAMLAANIVGAFEFVPEEVSSIIREHHGATNGIGFPSNLNISISPISQMFIVVEDFVDQFLKIKSVPSEADINRILSKIQSKYTKLTYEKTATALSKMIQLKK